MHIMHILYILYNINKHNLKSLWQRKLVQYSKICAVMRELVVSFAIFHKEKSMVYFILQFLFLDTMPPEMLWMFFQMSEPDVRHMGLFHLSWQVKPLFPETVLAKILLYCTFISVTVIVAVGGVTMIMCVIVIVTGVVCIHKYVAQKLFVWKGWFWISKLYLAHVFEVHLRNTPISPDFYMLLNINHK